MTAGWEEYDGKLTRSFELESFPAAVAFVGRVADVAEAQDHHPDIDIRWRTVRLAVNTHDQGGAITDKDHTLAEAINALLT
ncbi:MAG: pterin-4-alpha-carbinolamine dehydratase [Frankiales bacterium]|nr:pterin-4-alpha-carbinolamine dehydratase [Frankiales bacterium]